MSIDIYWIFLTALVVFLLYAAIAIKHEKKWAAKNQQLFQLNKLSFYTPHWWSVLEKTDRKIVFHRTDTKYDWQATCEFIQNQNQDLETFVIERLNEQTILFDSNCTDIIDKPNNIRIEGTATQKEETRLYLDIFVIRINKNEIYYFESRSSILNGCVEGPYFEDLIKSIKIATED